MEGLLSGEMPSTIAKSFEASKHRIRGRQTGFENDGSPPRDRSRSRDALQMNGKSPNRQKRPEVDVGEEEEASETTGLMGISDREAKRERIAKIALNGESLALIADAGADEAVNTVVNILLVAAKAVAVLYSSSISLTASLVDSALDLLSTFIILGTSWAIGMKTNAHLVRHSSHAIEKRVHG